MTVRRVCQWTIVLLLLAAAGVAFSVHLAWQHRNDLLLSGIRAEVQQQAPSWGVEIEGAQILDLRGKVRLRDIAVTPPGEARPLLHVPECVITLDQELLTQQRQVLVRSILLTRPTLTLTRHADGMWNWQKLGELTPSEQTPEVSITHGNLVLRFEAADGLPETEIASHDVAIRLIPSGWRRYLIQGATRIEGTGGLTFAGQADLQHRNWELAGQAVGLEMSPEMLEKAAALSPAVKRQVAELSQGNVFDGGGSGQSEAAEPVTPRTVSLEATTRSELSADGVVAAAEDSASQLSLPNLGLSARIGIDFHVRQDAAGAVPAFRVLAKFVDGQVSEPLSPVPLSGLEGELLLENDRVVIHRVSASNGESQLFLSGDVQRVGETTVRQFDLAATNLWLDREIRELLSPSGREMFDLLQPSGRFTIKAKVHSDGIGPMDLKLEEFTALDCTIQHALFPYPVTGVAGSIRQSDRQLTVALQGMAGGRPVNISGTISDLRRDAETIIHVEVDQFPVDRQFREAIVAPTMQSARRALEMLDLTGLANVRVQFARRNGPGERFQMGLDADLMQGKVHYVRFPYLLDGVSGHVHYNPWKEAVWRFHELRGMHGSAEVEGTAAFDQRTAPGRLDLQFAARQVPLDGDLRVATEVASHGFREAWEAVRPEGIVDTQEVRLSWIPGQEPQLTIPSMSLTQGSLLLSSFPYRLERVTAELSWKDDRLTIRRAEGWHNETTVSLSPGEEADSPFFELSHNAAHRWRLKVPELQVRNLDPGGEFRSALPGTVGSALSQLDPRGPIDAVAGLELMAFPQGPGIDIVTSHWQFDAQLVKDRLAVGPGLTDVTGLVTGDFKWDGESIVGAGTVELSRARTLDMTYTDIRGPFAVNGNVVRVGSDVRLRSTPDNPVSVQLPDDEQITAALYGGRVKLNAVAHLDPDDPQRSTYRALVDVTNVDLAEWARDWGMASANVSGTVRSILNLYGHGYDPRALSGENCFFQVTEARLGELPVLAQVLAQLIQPQQRDKTAFRYAYLEFSVHDGVFDFGRSGRQRQPDDTRRIQLAGDLLTLIGQGYVPFAPQLDPGMDIDLYSKANSRNMPLMMLPVVNRFVKPVSDNWIHVKVTGTPSAPQIHTRTEVPIDGVIRGLFETVEAGLTPVLPLPLLGMPSR
jgi:hypothetical protein